MSRGGYLSLLLKGDGSFWACGQNSGGLGIGTYSPTGEPPSYYPMQVFIPDSDTFALTITTAGPGTTTPSAGQVLVPYGTPMSISAVADSGYSFIKWSVVSGSAFIADPASPSTTVTLYTENATVQAEFGP
jgi:hypothetical protein